MNQSLSLQCELAMVEKLQVLDAAIWRAKSNIGEPADMPFVNLFRETTVSGANDTDDSRGHMDKWVLVCVACGQDDVPPSEVVDPLLVAAYAALQDETLGGLCESVTITGSRCHYDVRDGENVVQVEMQLEVKYDTARGDISRNDNDGTEG